MYVQPHYAMGGMEEVRSLIARHGWALLVVGTPGGPRAAHVPCLLDPDLDPGGAASELVLLGHTARADFVSAALQDGDDVLLVFQGPHGYVSPAWYAEGPFVPTWNFTAVHVRGVPEVLEGEAGFSVLQRTVEHFEAAHDEPWELSGDALENARRIASGTVPFRVRSTDVEAKAKLSQDKPGRIQDRIIASLERPGPYHNPRLAAEMRRVLGRDETAVGGESSDVPGE